ncbi:MAG: ferrochelatase [Mesorhizobium sp.]
MNDVGKQVAAQTGASAGGRIGVILANLGTPDGTDYASMRRYLNEFLSDTRVIELNRFIWQPILKAFVLTTRPQKSGANYRKIWNVERDESPLRTITRDQADDLAKRLADLPNVVVDWAMRYGDPSIADVVDRLTAQDCDRIVYFPLYPQYSATTTATANDKLYRKLMTMRAMPTVRSVPRYFDEPFFISALATSLTSQLAALDFEPEIVLASYHGIPKVYADKGDPYREQCNATTDLLRAHLGWSDSRLMTTFQSRFGAQEWLQPYTDKTVEKLAKEGVRRIAIMNPGFSADCIETLEEIDGEVREIFMHGGGEKFAHIACLNASPEGMGMIETIVRRELTGWL